MLILIRYIIKLLLILTIFQTEIFANYCEEDIFSSQSLLKYCKKDYLSAYFSLGLDGDIFIYNKRIKKNGCCLISDNVYLLYKSHDNLYKKKFELFGNIFGIDKFYLNEQTILMIRGIGGARLNYIQFFIVKDNNISKVKNGLFATNEKEPILIVDGDNIKIKMQYFNKISKKWISKFYYYDTKKEKFLQNAKKE